MTMDKETSSLPETKVTSSTDTGFERKSSSTAKGGVKRIRTQDERDPALAHESTLTPQYPAYRGVRRRSSRKWVSEIREPKKQSRICLGSFDTPEMAARAHGVAEVYLKGKKHALLNFPELIDHIPHPISLSPTHIQAAAAEAAVAFSSGRSCDADKRTRGNPPESSEPCSSSSSSFSHQLCTGMSLDFQSASVEVSGQADASNSSSVCTPTEGIGDSECVMVEEDLFESFNLFTNLAEALLLPPPPLFSIHEDEHNLEEVFLWSDF